MSRTTLSPIITVALGVLSFATAPMTSFAQTCEPCTIEQYTAPAHPFSVRSLELSLLNDARVANMTGDTILLLDILCQAAAVGIAEAEIMLGALSAEGASGVPRNEEQARRWFVSAHGRGSAKAAYALSLLYWDGRGGPQVKTEAIILLKEAAQAGLAEAQYLLGLHCVTGEALPRDLHAGHEWLKKAAAAGHLEAAEIARELRTQYPDLE